MTIRPFVSQLPTMPLLVQPPIPHQKLRSFSITSPTANVPFAPPSTVTDPAAALIVGKTVWMTTVVVVLFACEVMLEAVVDVLLGGAVIVIVAVAPV